VLIVQQQVEPLDSGAPFDCANVTFSSPPQTWAYTTTSALAVKGGLAISVAGAPFDCGAFAEGHRGRLAAPFPLTLSSAGDVASVLRLSEDDSLGEHACTLVPGPDASRVAVHVAGVDDPLVLPLSGALSFNPGTPYSDGTSYGSCSVVNIDPVDVPGLGVVCLTPSFACGQSYTDCNGTSGGKDVEVHSDGDIGACSDSYTCENECYTYCSQRGLYQSQSFCTGFCGGYSISCENDADCQFYGQTCNGPEPVGQAANICQCTCSSSNEGGTRPGQMLCNAGIDLRLEAAAPCDAADTIVDLGSQCAMLTTGYLVNLISDANFGAGTLPVDGPAELSGTQLSCSDLSAGQTSGLTTVGAANFFGSNLGDVAAEFVMQCQ